MVRKCCPCHIILKGDILRGTLSKCGLLMCYQQNHRFDWFYNLLQFVPIISLCMGDVHTSGMSAGF